MSVGKKGGQFRSDDASAFIGSLLTHAPVALAFLDRDLRYLAVNDVMAAANGLDPGAHIGRTIADVLPDLVPGTGACHAAGVGPRRSGHRPARGARVF